MEVQLRHHLVAVASCLSAVLFTSHQGTRYRLSQRRDATNKAIDGVIAPFTSSCCTAGCDDMVDIGELLEVGRPLTFTQRL
jgi:hypothetical protein